MELVQDHRSHPETPHRCLVPNRPKRHWKTTPSYPIHASTHSQQSKFGTGPPESEQPRPGLIKKTTTRSRNYPGDHGWAKEHERMGQNKVWPPTGHAYFPKIEDLNSFQQIQKCSKIIRIIRMGKLQLWHGYKNFSTTTIKSFSVFQIIPNSKWTSGKTTHPPITLGNQIETHPTTWKVWWLPIKLLHNELKLPWRLYLGKRWILPKRVPIHERPDKTQRETPQWIQRKVKALLHPNVNKTPGTRKLKRCPQITSVLKQVS